MRHYKANKSPITHIKRPHHYITKDVRDGVYEHSMKHIRSTQNHLESTFSKFTHNIIIEYISDVTERYVFRLRPLMYGALLSLFVGFAGILFSMYYGFKFTYEIVSIVFIIGYAIGYSHDLIDKFTLRNKRPHNN